jgi:hypothetical protein
MADVVVDMVLPDDLEESENGDNSTLVSRRYTRLSKRARQRREESSNATICPDYFAKLNAQLNTATGGRTAYTTFTRILCFQSSFLDLLIAYVAGVVPPETGLEALWLVGLLGFAVSTAILSLIPDCLRHVLQPGEHLATLGAGHVKISERAVKGLKSSRKWLFALKMVFRVFGGFMAFASSGLWRNAVLGPVPNWLWVGAPWLTTLSMVFGLVFPLIFDW